MDIVIFVVALSLLVLVHELGHFLASKLVGVRVEEFGLGLPPKIVGIKIGETVFSLNWLPIGGFCKLFGEDAEAKGSRAFGNKNPWQKMLVVLGGVLMNLVMAIIVFSVVYTIMGVPKDTDKVKVIGVAKNSPAETAGLKEDDWVRAVNGVEIKQPSQLTEEVGKYKGKDVELLIENAGVSSAVKVAVRENPPSGEGAIGIAISSTVMEKIKWYQFYKGIGAGFKEAYFWGKIIGGGVLNMIGGLFSGHIPKDVSGPIGMFEATSSIKKSQGMLAVIHFFGVVSVNLAVVNILPFPALDGGRIIFVVYELLSRRKANPKLEMAVNNFGMLVLLGLIVLITVGDVGRLIRK
jgi:regulator of sigma E protease